MCGRYRLKSANGEFFFEIQDIRITPKIELRPRYNIAPRQEAPIVRREQGELLLEPVRWGFVPSWAKDTKLAPINAKAEGLADKPMFRSAFKKRRCLVLADGFYEWRQADGDDPKQPMSFHFQDGRVFAFAGLWEERTPEEGAAPERTFTIITTEASPLVRPVHNRMPVILPPAAHALWLADDTPKDTLVELLRPHPVEEMEVYPVSTLVNSVKNIGPEVMERMG